MTIRNRLTLWFGGILLVSLVIMTGVVHFEFTEQQARLQRRDQPPEPIWEETAEIILFYGLPAGLLLLAGGWILLRKSLAPISALTQAAETVQLNSLGARLPRSGNGDELDRLTAVFNDMTARLDGSFQHIREFTLHASHELKTPLTILRGEFETALREEPLTEAQRERLFSHLDEVQRLAQIVDGLTLLTKADAGQVAIRREHVAFDELVRDSVEDAQTLGQSRGLTVTLDATTRTAVCGDRHRLRQLLLNLADNAVKYCDAGGRVTFSLARAGGLVELRLTNTGPGLPPELQPRVFERFFRGDPSHSHDTEGSGLGLAIAEWIVKAHGGTIRFESEAGTKTTVTVHLPLATGAPPAGAQA